MSSANFSEIAKRYERDSLVQKSAAEKLLSLVDIKRNESVLDLGCGPGNLTRRIRTMTDGPVAGIDASAGMISEAESKSSESDIMFGKQTVEEMDSRELFDVIFCNSVFQWFRDPERALRNCRSALVKGGRMGIQAPAKKIYCPNFVKAIEAVAGHPRTERIFSRFRQPWIFFDSAGEYSRLFERAGFAVPFAVIEAIKSSHKPDEAMAIFESGAAAGYLNQQFYGTQIDGAYTSAFREIVMESFLGQADGQGQVELIFNRVYLVAVK